MSYRDKTPTVLSIFVRKLKPGKTFEDFQKAHLPAGNVRKTEFGYDVDYFKLPTRVINAVSAEDPSIIYSIGFSYGDIHAIFAEVTNKTKEESGRHDTLSEIVEEVLPPAIAFVGSDNNYGGSDPDFQQGKLAKVTSEITNAIRLMKEKKIKED